MGTIAYEKQHTAVLVIDPYNDFISEGREAPAPYQNRRRGEQLRCPHAAGPECRAAGEPSRLLCNASSLPPRWTTRP